MFKAAEGKNFPGVLSAVPRQTVQEYFVFRYKTAVKIRKRISTFNHVQKFPGLQEIFSRQITQISHPFAVIFHQPGASHFSPLAFPFRRMQSSASFPRPANLNPLSAKKWFQ
jgi:hypothetical protein